MSACVLLLCNDHTHVLEPCAGHGREARSALHLLIHMQDMLIKCQLPGAPDDCLDILDDTDVKLILEEASQGDLQKVIVELDSGLSFMRTEGRAMHSPPA